MWNYFRESSLYWQFQNKYFPAIEERKNIQQQTSFQSWAETISGCVAKVATVGRNYHGEGSCRGCLTFSSKFMAYAIDCQFLLNVYTGLIEMCQVFKLTYHFFVPNRLVTQLYWQSAFSSVTFFCCRPRSCDKSLSECEREGKGKRERERRCRWKMRAFVLNLGSTTWNKLRSTSWSSRSWLWGLLRGP